MSNEKHRLQLHVMYYYLLHYLFKFDLSYTYKVQILSSQLATHMKTI